MLQTVRSKMSLISNLYSISSCLELSYITKPVNLSYTFKISPKAIIIGLHTSFATAYIRRFPLLAYKCFSVILHNFKGKSFIKKNMTKLIISQILYAILLLVSTKSEVLLSTQVQETFFRTWNSALSNNGSLIIYFNYFILIAFKMPQSDSKKYK